MTALLLACAVAVVGPGTHDLSAQTVLLRPHAGLNVPTRISFRNGSLQVRQKIGVTVGARLTLRFSPRFDVTTGVSYSPGYAVLRGAGEQIEVGAGTHSLSATTGARYWLLRPPRQLSWEVHTGLGVAFGGQPAYADLFESSTVNAVIGTALSYRVGRLVTLKLRVQERLYRVRFGDHPPGRSRSPLQVAFGFGFPFLESAR
jgi:hypothetical protein